MSWKDTRIFVYTRDKGICQVCKTKLKPKRFECGHTVDSILGGPDDPSNLVLMCYPCNRLKPLHKTRAEFDDWVAGGFWEARAIQFFREQGFRPEDIQILKKYLDWERANSLR